MKQKRYSVSPAREGPFRIDSKERLLYRFEWPDRIAQAVLSEVLCEVWERAFSDCLFSFRKGKSVWQAVGAAVKCVRRRGASPLYVIKRDVKSYGDSIPHDILFCAIEENLPGIDAFATGLIRRFIQFQYVSTDGETRVKNVGLPTGTALNCVLENLYLLPVDNALRGMGGVSYMRYGDDIWAAAKDRKTATTMDARMDDIRAELGLLWNEEKGGNYVLLGKRPTPNVQGPTSKADEFTEVDKIPHLGVAIHADGRVAIPAEKARAWRRGLKRILGRADYRSRLMGFGERERLRQLIHFANRFFTDRNLRFRKIDYLLTVVTKDEYFIELDRCVAQVVLSVLHGKFTKANFRKTPFRVLKEEGLESLYLRRRKMWMRKRRGR